MKAFVLAMILLAVMVTGVFLFGGYLKGVSEEMLAMTESAAQAADNGQWEQALREAERVEEVWREKTDRLTLLVNHVTLDGVTISVLRLKEFIRCEDKSETMAELAALKHLLGHLHEREQLTLKNIL